MVSRRTVLMALVACAVLPAALAAQSSKPCMIMGVVQDASRTPLSGVTIEAVSDVTGDQPHVISTDSEGKFQLTDLPSGTYTITASIPEYRTFKREGVYLAPGMNASMIFVLAQERTRD